MQPFDGGTFDQRFAEVFAPAIKEAGLEPYRVDQDPGVSIPIQDIESGIRQSQICLAEITLDNPNVWFELGFAIACKKEVVLVCSDARTTKFPFDVQHRTIITYKTGSPSDFDKLRSNIAAKIKAYLAKSETLEEIVEMPHLTAASAGLADHEVVALAVVMENLSNEHDHVSSGRIQQDMESSGHTRLATMFALKSLLKKRLLESEQCYDRDGDAYYGYKLTESGWDWMLANQNKFAMRKLPRPAPSPPT
jgi:nucleoside 2-deoxyribosyltransferase